jgi:tetratricopeptide (TPR) repeat protein
MLAGDPVDLGRVYSLLGLIANGAGRSTEAINYWNTALAIFEQYERQREIAIVCCNIGDVHVRSAEYAPALKFLHRSQGIAERIGETPLLCIVLNNLGLVVARSGNLLEAEEWFNKGIMLATQVNEPGGMSMLCTNVVSVLQDQGKLDEAKSSLHRALSISRSVAIAPFIGFALVALANMRLTQAILLISNHEHIVESRQEARRYLYRAKNTLHSALLLEVEAETRIEGELLRAQTTYLLDESELAQKQVIHVLNEASQSKLTWLVGRTQQVLGSILASQGKLEEAVSAFEEALRIFRKADMRLEQARTLHRYGLALLQQYSIMSAGSHQREKGLKYLREAQKIFTMCKAVMDEQLLARDLMQYAEVEA